MKILALELSSARGSIVFGDGRGETFAAEFANDRKHSGAFFEHLQLCYRECGQPERIVVGVGPGSYAGCRIAIAAAIGLQAISGAELRGIASIVALPIDEREYIVVGDARRQSFFFARIEARRITEGPTLLAMEHLDARLRMSDLPVFSTEALPNTGAKVQYPSARILLRIAIDDEMQMIPAPLEPIYLREPHITQPKVALR